jgi:hypothetical protein
VDPETAHLFNRDTGDRIAFVLEGDGLPATGEFNIEQINVGHICLGDVQNYGVQLRNSGELPFTFSLVERELPFLKFVFHRRAAVFLRAILGKLLLHSRRRALASSTRHLRTKLRVSRAGPTVTIYGRVVGPTFRFSKELVDFKTVSVGFLYSEEMELENVNEIPFEFHFSRALAHV